MNKLYLILDLATISVPLLYSVFEKEFYFWRYAKIAFLSIFIVAVPFIFWDVFFTKIGVWGFNDVYHLPFLFLGMPIEEWLFFFCIPYACLFTYEGFRYYFPNFVLSLKITRTISYCFLFLASALLLLNFGKWYTTVNLIWFVVLLGYTIRFRLGLLRGYLPSFLVILIPFFIVNGVLTGSWIDDEVVWYNNAENMGFRLGTVPFEDVFYAFNLLFTIQILFNYFNKK